MDNENDLIVSGDEKFRVKGEGKDAYVADTGDDRIHGFPGIFVEEAGTNPALVKNNRSAQASQDGKQAHIG